MDTEEVLYDAWAYAFDQRGFELTKELYWQLMIENRLPGLPTANLVLVDLGARLLKQEECADELLNDMYRFLDERRAKGFPPISATVNFLHTLALEKETLGLKLGLASGATKKPNSMSFKALKNRRLF